MVNTKTKTGLIIFAYFVLFPFGQVIRLSFDIFGVTVPIHPIDLLAGLSLVVLLFKGFKKPRIYRHLLSFLFVASFSFLLSLIIFQNPKALIGGFYLLRLAFYGALFILAWNLIVKNEKLKYSFFKSLIAITVFTAIFGWIQYFSYPDLRPFVIYGWDDHLFRLAGTFLDPGFTSILLAFGALISLVYFRKTKEKIFIVSFFFLLVTLAFTYSRAGYLAFIGGLIPLFALKKGIKKIAFLTISFIVLVLLLPRPGSEGVRLERTRSVFARFDNYSETLEIARHSPVLGVGFNNICLARQKYLGVGDFASHACSGADSSLLLVFATSGIVGLMVFIYLLYRVVKSTKRDLFGISFISCFFALLIHSLFVNSLFYPWVMGFMGILFATSIKE